MKAFVLKDHKEYIIEDRPEPRLADDYSVKVKATGICGSDLHFFEGLNGLTGGAPFVPGHEFCGEVVSVGKSVKSLAVGDSVIHEPINYCGKCYACRNGQGNVCSRINVTGCTMDGGYQEYFVASEKQWHKMRELY